jgi:SAM-dependent methyltransferase
MSSFRDFLFDRGRSERYKLAIAMTGVRMGERLLMVGDDAGLEAQLAAKLGLTGRCSVLVASEAAAARVTAAAAEAGVLLEDLRVAPLPALPVDDSAFDVAVVDAGPTFLLHLDEAGRAELARSLARALRPSGRLVVVEGRPQSPLNPFRGAGRHGVPLASFRAGGGATALLEAAGFYPIRLLADRDGQRFTEGRRRSVEKLVSR